LKALSPKVSSTKVGNSPWEWIPKTFEDFLTELEFVATHCKELEHLVLYRGHRDRRWLLDSTFARSCKKNVFGIEPWQKLRFEDFRMSTKHQQIVLNLFFFKFDFVARPSPELSNVAETTGVDPWFEFMKHLQQYPEEDPTYFKGTFLIDWTRSMDVGMYFANESREGEGALWICDATATGKTLQVLPVQEIMQRMAELGMRDASLGIPLIFHPRKQIAQKRAENQAAVYMAHMDLRVDLSEVWEDLQNHQAETILIKMVLPAGTEQELTRYLDKKEMTKEFIFPD
jgi:FRG domain